MCWDATTSLTFSLVLYGTSYYLYLIKYRYWERAFLILFIFGTMQLAQFFNWLTILPFDSYGTCYDLNKYATIFAYIALILQPLFLNLAVAIGEKNGWVNYKFPVFFAALFVIGMIVRMILGEYLPDNPNLQYMTPDFTTVEDERITCSYIGKYGYILWRFKLWREPCAPNFFLYQILGTTIFFADGIRQRVIGVFGMYVITFYSAWVNWGSAEAVAYWCHSTITVPFCFLIDAHLDSFLDLIGFTKRFGSFRYTGAAATTAGKKSKKNGKIRLLAFTRKNVICWDYHYLLGFH